ncbi:MAG: hypothetical protein AB1938_32610 [Myxococcota bacterium]
MRPSRLHFFNEQDTPELEALFSDAGVVRHLRALRAGVTMGMRDLSEGRARVVKRLVDEGVPVGAWLLLPRDEGYFATLDNVEAVTRRYSELHAWARREGLCFEAVGLDFEPDLRELSSLLAHPTRTLGRWAWRATDRRRLARAREAYQALIHRIRADGYSAETYQFPLVLEERGGKGSLWQRFAGALDVEADREVVMVYSSLLGPLGPGAVEAWAPRCRAIGVGSTGGGIDPWPKLEWEALARDLRVAARHCRDVTLFSLEGCVTQGFLARLVDFSWDAPVTPTPRLPRVANLAVRAALRGASRVLR